MQGPLFLYLYVHRLLSLNEIGGRPSQFEKLVSRLSRRSPFAIFESYRNRLGQAQLENSVFRLSRRSPFTIFVR